MSTLLTKRLLKLEELEKYKKLWFELKIVYELNSDWLLKWTTLKEVMERLERMHFEGGKK